MLVLRSLKISTSAIMVHMFVIKCPSIGTAWVVFPKRHALNLGERDAASPLPKKTVTRPSGAGEGSAASAAAASSRACPTGGGRRQRVPTPTGCRRRRVTGAGAHPLDASFGGPLGRRQGLLPESPFVGQALELAAAALAADSSPAPEGRITVFAATPRSARTLRSTSLRGQPPDYRTCRKMCFPYGFAAVRRLQGNPSRYGIMKPFA